MGSNSLPELLTNNKSLLLRIYNSKISIKKSGLLNLLRIFNSNIILINY